jgi:hypothetical protein
VPLGLEKEPVMGILILGVAVLAGVIFTIVDTQLLLR